MVEPIERQAYEILSLALSLDEAERGAYLAKACAGSQELRRVVDELLAADEAADAFLEPSALPRSTAFPPGDAPWRVSHYEIVEHLGSGGMGDVYLAHDLVLGRDVALKVLRWNVSAVLRERLLLEAEASARVQHPAIATFYEAGEERGVGFLALEYVTGETLRQRLMRAGALSCDDVLTLAETLLGALAHVHAAGLVHRDIKPENIMIRESGVAKLLDFGVAKLLASTPDTRESQAQGASPGTLVLGTPGYMSPEQSRGLPPCARSDLFALGAVLYEALTGERAFPGAMASNGTSSVAPGDDLDIRLKGIPRPLASILRQALARSRDDRYPSARAFLSDLMALQPTPRRPGTMSRLAVTEMRNAGSDPDDGWIGTALEEILIDELSALPDLEVVPPIAVARARGQLPGGSIQPEPKALGLALGCRWVVAGSYTRRDSWLRAVLELIDVSGGESLSTIEVEGLYDDLLAMGRRLCPAIAERLDLRPELGARGSIPSPRGERAPPRLDAYEYCIRGRREMIRAEKGSLDRAAEWLEKAVSLDTSLAAGYSGLAAVHALRFTFETDDVELAHAAKQARCALALDPSSAEARVWLGYALFRERQYEEAIRVFREAGDLDSTSFFAPYFTGVALEFRGSLEQARDAYRQAIATFALNSYAWIGLGWTLLDLGCAGEALWSLERAVELERRGEQAAPGGVEGYLGECLRRVGRLQDARARCLSGLRAVERSDSIYRDTFRGLCLCSLGRTALDQGDPELARTSFHQAIVHLAGRPRALGGGHLMVQALAGRSRSGGEARSFEDALELFRRRGGFSFHEFWCCTDDVTLRELKATASALGRVDLAGELGKEARGALPSRRELPSDRSPYRE